MDALYQNGRLDTTLDWQSGSSMQTLPQAHDLSASSGPSSATRRRTQSRAPSEAADSDPDRSASDVVSSAAAPPPPKANTGASATSNSGQKPKRKKATRACNACQKAHLTCDDSRPCQRCLKRGLGDSCQDGKRKKAKYLQDYADEVLGRRAENPANQKWIPLNVSTAQHQQTNGNETNPAPQTEQIPAFSHSSLMDSPQQRQRNNLSPGTSFRDVDAQHQQLFDPTKYSNDFDSHAANLEYAVLSSMLHGQTPPSDHNSAHTPSTSFPEFTHAQPSTSHPANLFDSGPATTPGTFSSSLETFFSTGPASAPLPVSDALNGSSSLDPQHGSTQNEPSTYPYPDPKRPQSAHQDGDVPSWPSGTTARTPCGALRTHDVYKEVNQPYPYAQSYHDLIRHLKERFEKTDILRIVRALAVFRPSLIALQMPLTEEDEVFIERCFQRTLIEFEKLISFSGTPTVCWRRTGEICLVGIEFSFLTKWDRSELVGPGKKRFIFELFDTSSCVEYYESFAKHAFENSTQTIMSTCVLLTPDQKPVPCSFCFTIKRDMFNCPSLVVGQFLPLLLA